MIQNRKSINVVGWLVLSTIGLVAGFVGGIVVGMSLGELVNAMILTAAVTSTVGTALGVTQAFGLRNHMKRPFVWILATAVGLGIGLAVGVVIVEQTGIFLTGERPNIARLSTSMRTLSFVVIGLAAGVMAGSAQWLIMRRSMPKVEHWVLACTIGLAAAFAVSSMVVDLSGLHLVSLPGFLTFIALSGISFGAFTVWPIRNAA